MDKDIPDIDANFKVNYLVNKFKTAADDELITYTCPNFSISKQSIHNLLI
jgi:hypothetical protein